MHESKIPLPAAPAACRPLIGFTPSYAAVRGWARRGVRTPSGERVRLAVQRAGGRWYTTADAIRTFIEATQAAAV